ncbi:amino acid permease [Planosporangium mesophilum]|uniref:Amino acid permease n=1 Tax=Planosporangium mesophilum TaxID=689768 RepID=A0A8J3THC0_9ACTN|nr:amino acid permease [Planosporangium mesophilum]
MSQALARDRLGVLSVIMFALTAAAPLMVVGALVTTAWGAIGVTGFPLGFVLMAAVLALFSFGYVAMSRQLTNAGAFYSYIAQGLGKPFGVAGSFVALLAYNMMQVGLYGVFGAALSDLLKAKFDLGVEWWVLALALWLFVAIMGLLRVEVNSRVLAVLLAAEIVVVVVFDVVFLANPNGGSITVDTFTPSSLSGPAVGAVLVTCITAFVGFEAAPVFSEEAKRAGTTVAAATFLGLAVMTVLYALTSWAASVTIGPANLVDAAKQQGPDLIFNTAAGHLNSAWIVDVAHALLLTSIAAGALSYHNTVTRYTFALGRERVLPAVFGRTRARSGAPQAASLAQSVVGLVVIVAYAVAGWDPLVRLFFWMGTTGGLGILFLITATSLAVVCYFGRDRRGENPWTWLLSPVLALLGLGYVIYQALANYANLLGVEPTSGLRWQLPLAYGVVAVAGLLWALAMRASRPHAYRVVGLGAKAAGVLAGTDHGSREAVSR